MALTSSFALQLVLVLLTLPLKTLSKPQRLVIKLIHRDAIFNLSESPSNTIADRVLKNSNARLAYLKSKTKKTSVFDDAQAGKTSVVNDAQAGVIYDTIGHVFVVNFSIGQPPIPQLAIMDTGSSLLWIHCLPCKNCAPEHGLVFDPSRSSTYVNLLCNNPICTKQYFRSLRFSCDFSGNCKYSATYANEVTTNGHIATEQLILQTIDEAPVIMPNIVFGCTHENVKALRGLPNGIFGLGNSPKSVVNQFGNRFSYCIGNVSDPSYKFNRLSLGEAVSFEGDSTPFEKDDNFYYITLQGMSLGQESISIDAEAFQRTITGGGLIIDSGSELSYVPQYEYGIIGTQVKKLLDPFLETFRVKDQPWRLCYKGLVNRDLQGFPVLTFHFSEGADLVLDVGSLFYHIEPEVFCLSIYPQLYNDDFHPEPSVIGMMAQQFYNIAYDLGRRRVYFQRIDCELLDD